LDKHHRPDPENPFIIREQEKNQIKYYLGQKLLNGSSRLIYATCQQKRLVMWIFLL